METAFRLAALEDMPALVALYGQLHPADTPVPPERLAPVLAQILESRHFELLVAQCEGEVAGTCYLNVIPNLSRGARPYAVIENVVVDQAARRRGIGKAMMNFALDRAWAQGCYKAMLQTGSKSESTYRFYRACGFSQTEKVAFVARPPHLAPNPA